MAEQPPERAFNTAKRGENIEIEMVFIGREPLQQIDRLRRTLANIDDRGVRRQPYKPELRQQTRRPLGGGAAFEPCQNSIMKLMRRPGKRKQRIDIQQERPRFRRCLRHPTLSGFWTRKSSGSPWERRKQQSETGASAERNAAAVREQYAPFRTARFPDGGRWLWRLPLRPHKRRRRSSRSYA